MSRLDDAKRFAIVDEFTKIHTEVTGAPRHFVNVNFSEYADGRMFTGGKPRNTSIVYGFVRAGRTREVRAELLERLSEAWCRITGQDARMLVLGLIELESTSVMEAGLIMPAPGEEPEWLRKNATVLAELAADDIAVLND
jgi:phenylpyruvate tautomerase PptA (4-oxalocrotonate tautomerase family)